MSAKKSCDTKIQDDEGMESGYLSGPLSEQLYSEDLDRETEKPKDDLSDKKDDSDKIVKSESSELDSGLDLCLSECLSNVKLCDSTQTVQSQGPLISIETEKPQDIPLFAILYQPDDDGDTQLHVAAVHGCEQSVGTLIRICPNKLLFDLPNNSGHTPLHLAAMSGHAVVTRMLVRAGASLGERDITGETPLHKAVTGNHLKCLQALLSPVPEHPPRKLSTILNQKNYKGQTCVHLAATAGHLETLQTLVYYGADINEKEGLAGSTALHIAVRRGDARTVQWLLQRCSGLVTNARNYAGHTPRRLANKTKLLPLFNDVQHTDDESDSGGEFDSDSDSDSLFEKLSQRHGNPINVA